MSTAFEASIIIVSFNTRDLLRECLHSLKQQAAGIHYEIIVVDNASRDQSADMVAAEFPEVVLIRSAVNLGFAAANNRGFDIARGEYIVLLNSDAFLQANALQTALAHLRKNPKIGMCGARLIGRQGDWQPSARLFPSLLNHFLMISGLAHRYQRSRFFGRADRTWANPNDSASVDWVPGAFAVIPHAVLKQIGFFDEIFFLYYEEVDLCLRIKHAGFEIWYFADVNVVHIGGESSKTLTHSLSSSGAQIVLWQLRSTLLYYRKHHGWLQAAAWAFLETSWHQIRVWKNQKSAPEKAEYSKNIITLLKKAWQETQGGKISPPRPW